MSIGLALSVSVGYLSVLQRNPFDISRSHDRRLHCLEHALTFAEWLLPSPRQGCVHPQEVNPRVFSVHVIDRSLADHEASKRRNRLPHAFFVTLPIRVVVAHGHNPYEPFRKQSKKQNKSLLAIAAKPCVFVVVFHFDSFQCFQSFPPAAMPELGVRQEFANSNTKP